jgi:hypothetical protein
MKKTLLTGIAVLFLATGTVHAVSLDKLGCEQGTCRPPIDTPFPLGDDLPKAMFSDKWCRDYPASSKGIEVYFSELKDRGPNYADRTERLCPSDSILMDTLGFDEETQGDTQAFCAFTKIEEKEKYVSYLVRVRCKVFDADQEEIFEEDLELQLINELLFIKRKSSV